MNIYQVASANLGSAIIVLILGQSLSVAQINNQNDERLKIESIIKKAASLCRTQPEDVYAKPGELSDKSQYLELIEPVLNRGRAFLPMLQELAASRIMDRFESRLIEILIRRIEHPEQFEKVAPYFTPDPRDPMSKLLTDPHLWEILSYQAVELKPIQLELMHESVRKVAAENSNAYQEVKKAVFEMLEEARRNPRAGHEMYKRLFDNFGCRLLEIEKEYKLCYSELCTLRQATGLREGSLPPMDDQYLMAWEEAMIRPVSWEMKHHFLKVVLHLDNEASLPSLGQVLRLAAFSLPQKSVRRGAIYENIIYFILESIMNHQPNVQALRELSDSIRLTDGKSKEKLQLKIGSRINARKPWQDFLSQTESDTKCKTYIDLLR